MRSAEFATLKQSSNVPLPRRSASLTSFRSVVWGYWKKNGRHELPWRKTNDPYKVLVSEVMLQQTQVDRVIPKYREFLKAFPTIRALARARLADVLRVWSGLGYNRRGKYLHDAAKVIVTTYGGRVPSDYPKLCELPGVGDYTAKAVRVFAWNKPDVLIETNIRTAFIHRFYSSILQKTAIADSEILPLLHCVAKGKDPRAWHWALMDYGAHLKRSGISTNHRSSHYAKQTIFEGSRRQVRGAILRALSSGASMNDLRSRSLGRFEQALAGLARDGLIVGEKGKWRIA